MTLKHIIISKSRLLRRAELARDAVSRSPCDSGLGVWNHDTVLNVEALDFCERGTDELCHDCEFGGGVDDHSGAVKGCVAHAVGVEIAAVGVAGSSISGRGIGTPAGVAFAHGLVDGIAGVRGVCC